MRPEFWKNRNVFVTGNTGFKGSWLCLWLQHLSAKVVGYSLPPPTDPSLYRVANVDSFMETIKGDVRDYRTLLDALSAHKPDIIFHMAAQSVVRESYEQPVDTYSTNVMGTVNLMEAVRQLPGKVAVINVTTDKVYENREWVWGYRETDRLGGHDPYSNSKACSELVTQSYRDSFFTATAGTGSEKLVATARAGNVIGGGDWTRDQLIPDIVNAFNEGRPVVIRSPRSVRPWQYVLDCLGGYLSLAERLFLDGDRFSGSWNFGPGPEDTIPVQRIVERLIDAWPTKADWILDTDAHPHEADYLRLDTSKTIMRLGWVPKLSIEESLGWIVEWYRGYFSHVDLQTISLEQIMRYEKKLSDLL